MRTVRKAATAVVRLQPVSRHIAGVMSGIDLRYPSARHAPASSAAAPGTSPGAIGAVKRPGCMRRCHQAASPWSPPEAGRRRQPAYIRLDQH